MATWHITAKPHLGKGRTFQMAIHALAIKSLRAELIAAGFAVQPMPEHHSVALTVSHSSESAITLLMLRHDVSDFDIQRIS